MIPDELYGELLAAVANVGADITDDCEQFLSELRTEFAGTDEDFLKHVQKNVGRWFRVITSYPQWVQNAEWQFHEGRPMVFAGEITIPKDAGLFHDDAYIFVFLSERGVIKNVIQIA